MSDCSIDAMKPKERPKTCGNCAHGKHVFISCWEGNDGKRHDYESFSPACKHWHGHEGTFKERFEQLGQVTKQLWNFLEARSEKVPQATYILGKTAEQLEALGVNIDD